MNFIWRLDPWYETGERIAHVARWPDFRNEERQEPDVFFLTISRIWTKALNVVALHSDLIDFSSATESDTTGNSEVEYLFNFAVAC